MLEITISESEKLLLDRTNLFNKENIISFCLLLSYGKIDNLSNTLNRKIGEVEINIKEQIGILKEKLKKCKEVRIWYSSNDNEDICNVYYLVSYLSKYDLKIYLCDVINNGRFALGCYNEGEIENLLERTRLLENSEKENYIKTWNRLQKENSDIRIVQNNTIKSYDFDLLDKEILELLSPTDSIRYWGLIAKCMMQRLYNFSSDFYFKDRIDNLIKENYIKIDKVVKEADYFGKEQITKYISINK